MNLKQQLIDTIEMIDADKSLSQPWKNYALSDARRALASLNMAIGYLGDLGKTDAHSASHAVKNVNIDFPQPDDLCYCKPGMVFAGCPVHGEKA